MLETSNRKVDSLDSQIEEVDRQKDEIFMLRSREELEAINLKKKQ